MRGAWRLLPWMALCPSLALSGTPYGAANLWLFEQPEQAAPLYRARIAGSATYQRYTAIETRGHSLPERASASRCIVNAALMPNQTAAG